MLKNVRTKPILILFGGQGREQVVLKLLENGYEIDVVVAPEEQSQELADSILVLKGAGIKIFTCNKSSLSQTLAKFSGDLLISIGFPYLLSEDVLRMFPLALNIHPTLLPKYRGPTTLAYIFLNGEEETGSTVHVIDEGMDTGPIVLQRSVKISKYDDLRRLQNKVYAIEPDLLLDALELLASEDFEPIKQDESEALSYPKKRSPADSEIDPEKRLIDLYDEIRATDPKKFPAFFFVDGKKVCVKFWWPHLEENEEKK